MIPMSKQPNKNENSDTEFESIESIEFKKKPSIIDKTTNDTFNEDSDGTSEEMYDGRTRPQITSNFKNMKSKMIEGELDISHDQVINTENENVLDINEDVYGTSHIDYEFKENSDEYKNETFNVDGEDDDSVISLINSIERIEREKKQNEQLQANIKWKKENPWKILEPDWEHLKTFVSPNQIRAIKHRFKRAQKDLDRRKKLDENKKDGCCTIL